MPDALGDLQKQLIEIEQAEGQVRALRAMAPLRAQRTLSQGVIQGAEELEKVKVGALQRREAIEGPPPELPLDFVANPGGGPSSLNQQTAGNVNALNVGGILKSLGVGGQGAALTPQGGGVAPGAGAPAPQPQAQPQQATTQRSIGGIGLPAQGGLIAGPGQELTTTRTTERVPIFGAGAPVGRFLAAGIGKMTGNPNFGTIEVSQTVQRLGPAISGAQRADLTLNLQQQFPGLNRGDAARLADAYSTGNMDAVSDLNPGENVVSALKQQDLVNSQLRAREIQTQTDSNLARIRASNLTAEKTNFEIDQMIQRVNTVPRSVLYGQPSLAAQSGGTRSAIFPGGGGGGGGGAQGGAGNLASIRTTLAKLTNDEGELVDPAGLEVVRRGLYDHDLMLLANTTVPTGAEQKGFFKKALTAVGLETPDILKKRGSLRTLSTQDLIGRWEQADQELAAGRKNGPATKFLLENTGDTFILQTDEQGSFLTRNPDPNHINASAGLALEQARTIFSQIRGSSPQEIQVNSVIPAPDTEGAQALVQSAPTEENIQAREQVGTNVRENLGVGKGSVFDQIVREKRQNFQNAISGGIPPTGQ